MLQAGRIIQYRLPSGEWRPGIVLDAPAADGSVEAIVFTKTKKAENRWAGGHSSLDGHTVCVTGVHEGEEVGCWRWPPQADQAQVPEEPSEEPGSQEAPSE